MIQTGLVSVTFRKFSPADIISITQRAGLAGVEWGGDVHVPHGDIAKAKEVGQQTRDAGLKVAAYGSYFRICAERNPTPPFEQVLETAVALQAPCIRIWAGVRPSEKATDATWDEAIAETCRIADLAKPAGMSVAFEFHGNSLNDCAAGARRLLRGVDRDNVQSCWQPDPKDTADNNAETLRLLKRRLCNVHVFYWKLGKRKPLAEGVDEWRRYLAIVAETQRDHFALLEFVLDDSPVQFKEDAAALTKMVQKAMKLPQAAADG
jgi:sugar phosphate isomerase/epimerase